MPNMSYCQFQNTLLDLRQCYDVLVDDGIDAISPEELKALHKLRKLCEEFIDEYDDQVNVEEDVINPVFEDSRSIQIRIIDEPAAVSIDEPIYESVIDDFKPYQYNVGDKVRIIGNSNSHGHVIDDVVTITMQYSQYVRHNVYQVNDEYIVRECDMELAEQQRSCQK